MTSAIEAQGLTHRYGERTALDDVSFAVDEAEIFALLGPNGGGKTTLFRILSTLFPPSAGTASILGLDLRSRVSQIRTEIGVVFQNPSLDAKLTVWENILHQGHLYGLYGKTLRARADGIMERLQIANRSRDRVETLSGGLKRRVELAKGLLHEPRILILDEPSVGLDPGARHDLWQYLEQLRHSEGVTVLVTTHLIDEADRANRVLILNKGRVVVCDTPQNLKQEIGGDVIALESTQAEALRKGIAERFHLEPHVLNGSVRIEPSWSSRFRE
jgi:ABC-2 type transport system ATP-binding protein